MELEASIAAVRASLLGDERVATAILFGSAAKGLARPSSDLDVAIIARSAGDLIRLQAQHLELAGRLSSLAGREVQLVFVEKAEPVLARQTFLAGRTLFDRNPARTADVLERVLTDYFDGEYHRRLRAAALDARREARHG